MDRFCVALPIKFMVPNYKAYISTDDEVDVGQNLVDGQTMMDTWIDWTYALDTNYISDIPVLDDVSNFTDPRKVAAASHHISLWSKELTLDQVLAYQ